MRTTRNSIIYCDSCDIQNDTLKITPENSCDVLFSNDSFFRSNTTKILDWFLADKKTYMVFNFGLYEDSRLYIVSKYEPSKCASGSAPSISMIKSSAIDDPWFSSHDGTVSVSVPHERLRPLLQAIVNTLPIPNERGLYTIEGEPPLFKAQLSRDRSGFRKIWINGDLLEEKNYGDCSMVFSVVGVYLSYFQIIFAARSINLPTLPMLTESIQSHTNNSAPISLLSHHHLQHTSFFTGNSAACNLL